MGLKETMAQMRQLLTDMLQDLEKAARDNRAAAQRVRTDSVQFTKIAKVFRKESLDSEKSLNKAKKVGRPAKKRGKR